MPYATFNYIYPSLLERQKKHAEADIFIKEPLFYSIYNDALVLPGFYTPKLKNTLGGG